MNADNFNRSRIQAGLSLIELMIAMTVGLIITAGVLQVFVSTLGGSRELLSQARLENDLNSMLHWMSNDIRRAGYWGAEGFEADWGNGDRNPFTENVDNVVGIPGISIGETASSAASGLTDSCALYSYNLDGNKGDVEAIVDGDSDDARIGYCASCGFATAPFNDAAIYDYDNMEMFGYRLQNGEVQMRTGPVNGESTFTCETGSWAALSDIEVINVTGLSFDLVNGTVNTITASDGTELFVETMQVEIQLTAELASDSSVRKTLTTSVKLGNSLIRE